MTRKLPQNLLSSAIQLQCSCRFCDLLCGYLTEKGPISVAPSSRLNCRKSIHCSFVFVCLFAPNVIFVNVVSFISHVHLCFYCEFFYQCHSLQYTQTLSASPFTCIFFIDFWTILCAIEKSYILRGVRFRVSFLFGGALIFTASICKTKQKLLKHILMQAVRFKACCIFCFGEQIECPLVDNQCLSMALIHSALHKPQYPPSQQTLPIFRVINQPVVQMCFFNIYTDNLKG